MLIGGEIFAMTEEFLFVKISWNIKLEKNIFIFLLYIFVKA